MNTPTLSGCLLLAEAAIHALSAGVVGTPGRDPALMLAAAALSVVPAAWSLAERIFAGSAPTGS